MDRSPPEPPKPCSRVDVGIVVALFAVALAGSFALGGWAVDDSWIVLRYVRNILAGHGWVYNLGEHVNGSTSALNTMVLVVIGWCTGDLGLAQYLTLAGAIGGTAAIWFFELRPFGRLPASMAALIVLASPMPFATLGLESSLVLFFGSASVVAFRRDRLVLAGVCYGLLFLARGDGILLGLPLALVLLWKSNDVRDAWRKSLPLFGAALAVVTPWLVYSWVTFGSPVPQTFGAKLAQTSGGAWGDDTFFAWIPFYFSFLDWRDLDIGPWPFAILLIVGSVLAWRRRAQLPAIPIILAWSLLQCAAYSALQLPRYHWYFTQMLFATTLAVAVVIVSAWGRREAKEPLRIRHLAAVLVCCGWLYVTTIDFARLPKVHYPVYQRAAKWINDNAPRHASIAVMDIGVFGYLVGDRPIIDMCSLVIADGVKDIAAGRSDWWYDKRPPDYIVVHEPPRSHFELPALQRPDFAERYEHVADPISGIRIYRRRALAAPR